MAPTPYTCITSGDMDGPKTVCQDSYSDSEEDCPGVKKLCGEDWRIKKGGIKKGGLPIIATSVFEKLPSVVSLGPVFNIDCRPCWGGETQYKFVSRPKTRLSSGDPTKDDWNFIRPPCLGGSRHGGSHQPAFPGGLDEAI